MVLGVKVKPYDLKITMFRKTLIMFIVSALCTPLCCFTLAFPEADELYKLLVTMPIELNDDSEAFVQLKKFVNSTKMRREIYIKHSQTALETNRNEIIVVPVYNYVKGTVNEGLKLLKTDSFRNSKSGLITTMICIKYVEYFMYTHFKAMPDSVVKKLYNDCYRLTMKLNELYVNQWQGSCMILLLDKCRVRLWSPASHLIDDDVESGLWIDSYIPEKPVYVNNKDIYFKIFNNIYSEEGRTFFRFYQKAFDAELINFRDVLLKKAYTKYIEHARSLISNRNFHRYYSVLIKALESAEKTSGKIFKENNNTTGLEMRKKEIKDITEKAKKIFNKRKDMKYGTFFEENEENAKKSEAELEKRLKGKKYEIKMTPFGYSIKCYKPLDEEEWEEANNEAKKLRKEYLKKMKKASKPAD